MKQCEEEGGDNFLIITWKNGGGVGAKSWKSLNEVSTFIKEISWKLNKKELEIKGVLLIWYFLMKLTSDGFSLKNHFENETFALFDCFF